MVEHLLLFQKILLSLAIGALIGLERERRARGREFFAGVRTFMLVALFGLLSGFLSQLIENFLPIYIGLFGIIGFAMASYLIEYSRIKVVGMTTEIAFIITYLIGILLFFENLPYFLSISLGILLTLILISKESLHKFARHLTKKELRDAVIFAVISFVILPILPDRTIDPFHILNPFIIWLSLVFVLSISFFAYAAMRIFGAKKGLELTGIFGGLATSTGVAVNMAEKVALNKKILYSATFAIVIAGSVMFIRQWIVASFFNSDILNYFLPFSILSLTGILLSLIPLKKSEKERAEIELGSPLALRPALKFILFFILIYFISHLIRDKFGFLGLYTIALIAGLVEVDAITISLVTMGINPFIAANGMIFAGLSNTFSKWFLVNWLGTKEISREVGKFFAVLILIGFFLLYLLNVF
ncbi:MAG: DUF4010 domain-containing protein [Candidatus Aenigmatarchaeota archaeon]